MRAVALALGLVAAASFAAFVSEVTDPDPTGQQRSLTVDCATADRVTLADPLPDGDWIIRAAYGPVDSQGRGPDDVIGQKASEAYPGPEAFYDIARELFGTDQIATLSTVYDESRIDTTIVPLSGGVLFCTNLDDAN